MRADGVAKALGGQGADRCWTASSAATLAAGSVAVSAAYAQPYADADVAPVITALEGRNAGACVASRAPVLSNW